MLQERPIRKRVTEDLTLQEGPAKRTLTWEEWMIKKAHENRTRTEQNERNIRIELEKQKSVAIEKERQRWKAQDSYEKWLRSLERKEQKAAKIHDRKIIRIKEEALTRKEHLRKKASAKYDEWITNKQLQEKDERQRLKEEKLQSLKNVEYRRFQCQEAYNAWVKKAAVKSRINCTSYGYANGTLTGYYDSSAKPQPSFINPVPWDR